MNPLYNDISYNSKICYNVNAVCSKIAEAILTNAQIVCFPKETVEKYPLYILQMGHINFLYDSKLDFTARSLGTNTVAITRVLCILKKYGEQKAGHMYCLDSQGSINFCCVFYLSSVSSKEDAFLTML